MLLGKKAPLFSAPAVIDSQIVEDFSLSRYIGEKCVLLFFYPADFSGLCTTEVRAFQERVSDFEALGVQLVGCSTDSKFSHLHWVSMPEDQDGVEGVSFPLVSDQSLTISMDYHALAGEFHHRNVSLEEKMHQKMKTKMRMKMQKMMIKKGAEGSPSADHEGAMSHDDKMCGCDMDRMMRSGAMGVEFEGIPMAYRATYIIDTSGIIRHQSMNEFAMGRNIDDYIRLIKGLHLINETGGACAANWKPE